MSLLMASTCIWYMFLVNFMIGAGSIEIQIPVKSEPWARERECMFSRTGPSWQLFTQNMAGEWNSSHVVNQRYNDDDVFKTTLWRITEDESWQGANVISFEFKVRKITLQS